MFSYPFCCSIFHACHSITLVRYNITLLQNTSRTRLDSLHTPKKPWSWYSQFWKCPFPVLANSFSLSVALLHHTQMKDPLRWSIAIVIARNGRQNPYILIWLGPGRRTGRRRGSVTQKPLPYKVNGVFEVNVFCLRKSVLLDVDVFCIRWLLFRFASIFRKKKKKKKS